MFINDPNYTFADLHIAEGPIENWSFPTAFHLDHILITNELFDYTTVKPANTDLAGLTLASLRATALYRFLVIRGGFRAETMRAFGRQVPSTAGQSKQPAAGHVLLKVIGGTPLYDLEGNKGKIKIGDFTFE